MSPRGLVALLSLVAVLAAGCGGDKKKDEAAPRAVTTTTAVANESAAPGGAPLTGVPGDPARLERPALIVKIDNAPKGRPQAGINGADVVIEEAVEGGITRLAAIFHSNDVDTVGPVRSARSTDIAIASALNHPLFSYSGASQVFLGLVRSAPLVDVGVDRRPAHYRRDRGRPQLYNLMASLPGLFSETPEGAGPPAPMFTYRAEGAPIQGEPTAGVNLEFRGRVLTAASWRWDPATSTWSRAQNGTAHVDAAGAPVAPRNVVVQFVPYKDTGFRDQSGEPVPEAELVGEGEAWVFTAGKLIRGRWKKPAPETPTQYTDASGATIALTPGQTWIELPKPGMAAVAA